MVDDLKRQASELYKERTPQEGILTSDSLSMKKLVYVSLGLLLLLLIVIQSFGGFKRRQDPIATANTPPPLLKEAPPPELLQPEETKPSPQATVPVESTLKFAASTLPPKPAPSKPEVAKPPLAEPEV